MKFASKAVLSLLLILVANQACFAVKASAALSRDRLAETADLFFGADENYHSGDLIVKSQVADFQDFLRKTQGRSIATSAKLLRRTEPDSSRLARVFFSPGGRQTMRSVAEELGGYEPIIRYCKTNQGLQSLKTAVKLRDASGLKEQIASQEAIRSQQKKQDKRSASSRPGRIYTAEQLVEAMLPPARVIRPAAIPIEASSSNPISE